MEVCEQLDEWVKGNSIHNIDRDECCPDFSCCNGKPAPKSERERFAKAYYDNDKETQYLMLGMFLGEAFSDKKVYIAGEEQAYHELRGRGG